MNKKPGHPDAKLSMFLHILEVLERLQAIAPSVERAELLRLLGPIRDMIAAGDPVDLDELTGPAGRAYKNLQLIEASSLGTAYARSRRRQVDPAVIAKILARSATTPSDDACYDSTDLWAPMPTNQVEHLTGEPNQPRTQNSLPWAESPQGERRPWPVVAAVDLGTHGSGFAWTTIEDRHDDPARRPIHTLSQWPAQSVVSLKTPTSLLLDSRNEVVAWGAEAHLRASNQKHTQTDSPLRFVHGFKMALGSSGRDHANSFSGSAVNDREPDPERLLMLYLKQLYSVAVAEIAKGGYREEEIRWCITVPAIWDDHQKQLVRQSAVEAGFPHADRQLLLALEPEAAAHYARGVNLVFAATGDNANVNLATPGRRFVVADCGGGTVDVTSYEVVSADGMIEIGTASGDRHGSMYLDHAFEELVLCERLGGPSDYERLKNTCPDGIRDVLHTWERIKQHIGVGHSRPIYIALPAALWRKISVQAKAALAAHQEGDTTQIIVEPGEIREIFQRVVPKIVELVDEQLAFIEQERGSTPDVETVLLVGGFAASPYLRQTLADHLNARAQVVIPPDPFGAVLQGAAHFAYEPQIRARRVKYTYGTATCRPFEAGVDPQEKLITIDAQKLCEDRFSPLIRAGEMVGVADELVERFTPVLATQADINIDFYRTGETSPRYVDEPGCEPVGTLTINLAEVMHLDITRRAVEVGVLFGEGELRLRARIMKSGQPVEARFSFWV